MTSQSVGISFHTHESLTHRKPRFFKAFMTKVYTFGTFPNAKGYIKFVYCYSRAHNVLKNPPNSL